MLKGLLTMSAKELDRLSVVKKIIDKRLTQVLGAQQLGLTSRQVKRQGDQICQQPLPEAKITFNKFHILKIINEAVDDVRRMEVKENPLLKGTRYLFLKNEQNLTQAERNKKAELQLSTLNIKVFRALSLRETFQQIYAAQTGADFETLLKKWYFWATHSRLNPMKKAAKTIKNHWDGILQWKKSQINNGILEGLNSVVQAAKRKARGYKFKHFKTIVYLITGGLDFSKVNSACLPT